MNIADLASAVAPGCTIEEIGIRPGEKLHEVLISDEETQRTYDFDGIYVIEPAHSWWNTERPDASRPVPKGFRYSSDLNETWLSSEQLNAMIAGA